MILWRIAAETRKHAADDLSGLGAAARPGRWNNHGQPVVYTALSVALAVLETAAHIDDAGLPLNRYLIRVDVPEDVWRAREEMVVGALPHTWSAVPAGRASVEIGSRWLSSGRSPILVLPSVIVPEEQVALINPQHPSATRIAATIVRSCEYSRLFREGGASAR